MSRHAQRPTAVRLDDLRSRLENVDNSSYSELLAFKQALEQLVIHGTAVWDPDFLCVMPALT